MIAPVKTGHKQSGKCPGSLFGGRGTGVADMVPLVPELRSGTRRSKLRFAYDSGHTPPNQMIYDELARYAEVSGCSNRY